MVAHIPPQFLYRYRSANTNYFAEEIRRAIHGKEIYLTSISNLNDPFEALPFVAKNTPKEVREYLAKFEKLFGKGVAITGTDFGKLSEDLGFKKSRLRKVVGPSLESANHTISFLRASIQHLRKHTKVACLSERWDSLLMWGHYGQSHTGVCVEYAPKLEIAARERVAPLAMEYAEQRPTVTYIELMEHSAQAKNENKDNIFDMERVERTFNSIAMTKPKDWEYEKEWRIMDVSDALAGYSRVAALEPKSILIGANHSPATLEIVRKVVSGKIDIEIVSLDKKRFALRRKLA